MSGRCALRLRQCIHLARKCGVLSRRSAAGSVPPVTRHRQVHAPCKAETGNVHKRRSPKKAHRYGVFGYKGARRKRLAAKARTQGHESDLRGIVTESRWRESRWRIEMTKAPLIFSYYIAAPVEKVWSGFVSKEA